MCVGSPHCMILDFIIIIFILACVFFSAAPFLFFAHFFPHVLYPIVAVVFRSSTYKSFRLSCFLFTLVYCTFYFLSSQRRWCALCTVPTIKCKTKASSHKWCSEKFWWFGRIQFSNEYGRHRNRKKCICNDKIPTLIACTIPCISFWILLHYLFVQIKTFWRRIFLILFPLKYQKCMWMTGAKGALSAFAKRQNHLNVNKNNFSLAKLKMTNAFKNGWIYTKNSFGSVTKAFIQFRKEANVIQFDIKWDFTFNAKMKTFHSQSQNTSCEININ